MELTVQDVERIIAVCKPGTAEYVANGVYRAIWYADEKDERDKTTCT